MQLPWFLFDLKPFLVVLAICWFAFCALLMLRPHFWIESQNRYLRQHGIEITIIDDKRFVSVHRKAGFWLTILGICLCLIVFWYITGLIPL